ncbi:MAG: hypothetical protein PHI37_03980 [Candidatus Gracilibacteria bacterium]|nr:hypothetical protein [Candidatus Gracilibacteria bacterium]
MQDLKIWEDKIKEKRKKTNFRDFVKEICSWQPLSFYNIDGKVSRYPKSNRIKIIDDLEFNKKATEQLEKGDLINGANFLKLLSNLWLENGLPRLWHFWETENSTYSETVGAVKNAYLTHLSFYAENILYSFGVSGNAKNVLNSSLVVNNSQEVYNSVGIINSYKIFYSKCIIDSNNIWFSTNLIGCQECILCDDLQNQSFCIKNIKYEKSEYFEKKKEVLKYKKLFSKYSEILSNVGKNINSSNLINSSFSTFCENLENSNYVYQIKNGRNLLLAGNFSGKEGISENIYDNFTTSLNSFDIYGGMGTSPGDNGYCNINSGDFSHIYYSGFLFNCSFCLGCIGLKNKSFCILNKEYEKSEWYELANKIFAQMDSDGILGDFFPGSLNPFYFNDTMAYLIDDSFTKEEVEKDGYMWRDEKIKVDIPENSEIVEVKDLNNFQGYDSNGNWFINPEIMKKVIQDKNGNIYKIVKMEYDFLMKHGLPLPEIHWLDRIKMGFKFN